MMDTLGKTVGLALLTPVLTPNNLANLPRVVFNKIFSLRQVDTKLTITYINTTTSYKEKDENSTPGKLKFKISKI